MSETPISVLDSLCPSHGWLSHAVVHEAAHAVFAVDLGIPFVQVAIGAPQSILASMATDEPAMAGGVRLVEEDATRWMPARPDTALDFCLAGSLAERGAYGHSLERSHEGDIRVWKIGMGLVGEVDAGLAAESIRASVARVDARLAERGLAILAVARALTGRLDISGNGRYSNFDEPLVLTHVDVCAVLRESS